MNMRLKADRGFVQRQGWDQWSGQGWKKKQKNFIIMKTSLSGNESADKLAGTATFRIGRVMDRTECNQLGTAMSVTIVVL